MFRRFTQIQSNFKNEGSFWMRFFVSDKNVVMKKGWKGTGSLRDPLINYRNLCCQSWKTLWGSWRKASTKQNLSCLLRFWEVTQFLKATLLLPFTSFASTKAGGSPQWMHFLWKKEKYQEQMIFVSIYS